MPSTRRRRYLFALVFSIPLAPTPGRAQVDPPSFHLDFSGPLSVGGAPGAVVRIPFKCRLHTTGVPAGEAGVQSWSVGVAATGGCRIVAATTLATSAAPRILGGLRIGEFELTELTSGVGNEGVVSTVILDVNQRVTLEPGSSPHDILGIELEAIMPRTGECRTCVLTYRDSLAGSGLPVSLLVTYDHVSFTPSASSASFDICPVPCFPPAPTAGWAPMAVGADVTGAARAEGGFLEICSASRGREGRADSLYALSRNAGADFEMSAEVVSFDGQAGVEARVSSGKGADPEAPVLAIYAELGPKGGVELHSVIRREYGSKLSAEASRPAAVELPVRIGVRREGPVMSTFFIREGEAANHMSLDVTGVGIDAPRYITGMAHASDPAGDGHPRLGSVRFAAAVFEAERTASPPVLSRTPSHFMSTAAAATEITVTGIGLRDVTEVLVAGMPAQVIEAAENEVTFLVPPAGRPLRGDIVVRTPGGSTPIPSSFFSYESGFLRCDCEGDGNLSISDAIRHLGWLFLGGPPCDCAATGDCNGDGQDDLSDAVSLLAFLFLGGEPPPPPHPEPGIGPGGETCSPEPIVITGITPQVIAPGDRVTIEGRGFSEIEAANVVLLGDAELQVVEATPRTLVVQVGHIVTSGRSTLSILRDFDVGIPLPGCPSGRCSPTAIGPAFSAADLPLIERVASADLTVLGSSQVDARGNIVIDIDSASFDPGATAGVTATVLLPVIQDVSPGARSTSFEHTFSRQDLSFEEAVSEIARGLEFELSGGGGPLPEILVLPDPANGRIVIEPSDRLREALDQQGAELSGFVSLSRRPVGRCGESAFHPLEDERDFAWCRFEEIVSPCDGLPAFEWFVPEAFAFSEAGDISSLPHPEDRSPALKAAMYNYPAFCHIRRHGLWNVCELENLLEGGSGEIPPFPPGAWVVHTAWRGDDPGLPESQRLPQGVDPGRFYSYVYSGDGRRYYLTALHHISKDVDGWFWYDAHVPGQAITAHGLSQSRRGVGGCGGMNLDAPEAVKDSIWKDYFLCTNVTATQPLVSDGLAGVAPGPETNSAACGNFEFGIECPDILDGGGGGGETCLSCHGRAAASTVAGSIRTDFLYSIPLGAFNPGSPAACGGPGDAVEFASRVQPVFDARCSCHTGGAAPGGLSLAAGISYDSLVGVPSLQSGLLRVEAGSPARSYLWHKLSGTQVSVGGSGERMPFRGSALPASKLALIEAWILQGASP